MAKQLLLGNQAAAMGARDGGIAVISSYPGTPSTEITETAAAFPEVYTEWAANEKVAAEAALGSAVTGKRAMCCMKHVGLNVAADLLFTAAYTGVNAGLVLAVADDPGMHSSQNEQDTRMIAQAAHVPVLEPADSQECYDYFKYAPQLSETLDMPVIVRLTTRISHARGFVALGDQVENFEKDYEKQPAKYIMMPGYARGRKVDLLKRIEAAKKLSDSTELNRIEAGDGKVGVICSGVCYQYVKEALPHASILKLGMVYPLPEQKIRDFAASVEKLYVVEELEPYIQRYVESLGIEGIGDQVFGKAGELSANLVRQVVEGVDAPTLPDVKDLPPRPPALCAGCPHRGVFYVLKKMGLTVFGDIGCYTLGATPPLGAMDTTICMGASISMAHGAEKAKGRDFARKSLAIIGDSTFFHSGMTGLATASYNKSNITVLIVDNSTTGMTGHQDNPATGKTLKGEYTEPLSLESVCRALGAQHIRVVDSLNIVGLQAEIQASLNEDGVSVVIARRPCVMIVKGQKNSLQINAEKCIGCGACLKTGCPALQRKGNKVTIDQTLCNACGLCAGLCPKQCMEGASK